MGKKLRAVQPVVKIIPLDSPKNDYQYWQSQSYESRIHALEEIRAEYHRMQGDVPLGIQKVVTIIKQK